MVKLPLWTNKEILKGGEPIFLQGGKKIGVLLIHGWSSTPQELRGTADYLNSLGYPVYAPLLRGHGTEPRDLIGLKWEDWLEDVCRAYDWFSQYVDGIIVGGMSTGSLLALNLSQKREVRGIIAMGTPIFTRLRWRVIIRALSWVFRNRKMLRKMYRRKEDREVAEKKVHYSEFPPRSMMETARLIPVTKRILPGIKEPILIMHSRPDSIILPKSSEYLYDNIGSKEKELVFFENSYHVFTVDKHAGKAHRIIGDFINKISYSKHQAPGNKHQTSINNPNSKL